MKICNKVIGILSIVLLLGISFMLESCKGNSKNPLSTKSVLVPSVDRPTDMVLIYHGYKNRPAWTAADLQPYIFRNKEEKVEWLFDGFLFLEIYASRGKIEYDFCIPHHHRVSPDKSIWEELLKKTFADGKGPDGIEQVIDSLVQQGIQPPYKRQVMFGLPNPQIQCENFGSVDGRKLDVTKVEDRLIAVKWYVHELLNRWKAKNYQYIELTGFYWLHEQIDSDYQDDILIKEVQAYLNSIGYPLTWIPYYGAEGAHRWKEMGFDIAYQQPNYFFNLNSPMEIITGAIEFAKKNEMALEMEFDDRVSEAAFAERFYTYLEEFEKAGAWNEFPIAYYEGGGAWLRMYRSDDPKLHKMYDALSDILVKRNGKFSQIQTKE